jgi:Dockerin type I domain
MKLKYIYKILIINLAMVSSCVTFASASQSSGTIDATYHYATVLGTTTHQINFLPTIGSTGASAITIDDTNGLDGHAWGNSLGWINMGPTATNTTQINSTTGAITGYAWSQIGGWINFAPTNYGVTINANGEFSGYAWVSGDNGGWLKFDCTGLATSTCVKTDWRPISARTTAPSPSGGGGGGGGGGSIVGPDYYQNQTGEQNQKTDYSNDFRADINDSGKVDLYDFNILMVNWNKVQAVDISKSKPDRCQQANLADVNCDGKVSVLDFNVVIVYWGQYVGRQGEILKSKLKN